MTMQPEQHELTIEEVDAWLEANINGPDPRTQALQGLLQAAQQPQITGGPLA